MAQNRKFHNGKMAKENAFSPKPDNTKVLCYAFGLSATVFLEWEVVKLKIFK